MKMVRIAYLYFDLCHEFGEEFNIDALVKYIRLSGGTLKVTYLNYKDKIDFERYDLFYLPSSKKYSQNLIINDLMKYKDKIKEAISKGKVFIVLGNSMEIFGKKIRTKKGLSIKCLDIFPYQTREEKDFIISDAFYDYESLGKHKKVIAFKNKNTNIVHNDNNRMFIFSDSYNEMNFFAMQLVGPILVRNPYFTLFIIKRLFEYVGLDFSFNEESSLEIDAYNEFVLKYITNKNLD